MTSLAAVCIATAFFMFLQDVLGSGLTISQARALRFWPGLFDGLGDFVNRYGVVIAAVTGAHYGLWSWQLLLVTTVTAFVSFFTSNTATGKESKLLPKSRLAQVRGLHLTDFGRSVVTTIRQMLHRPTKQGDKPMSLLDDIERRFTIDADRVVSDAEKAAKTKIGTALVDVAKVIVPLVPEGREAALVLTKLEEVEAWAHRALATASTVTQAVAAVDPQGATGAAAPTQPSTDAAAAPAGAEAAAVDPSAPASDTAASVASTTASAPAAPADTSSAEPAPTSSETTAAPVNPGNLFTFGGDVSTIDATVWPVAPFKTPDGQTLYTWAGQGPAPSGAEPTWVAYAGPVVAA